VGCEKWGGGTDKQTDSQTDRLLQMRLTFSGTELKSDYHTIIKGTRKKRKREFNSPLAFCYLALAPLSSLKKWLKISACTSRREKYYAKASVYYLRNDSAGNWIREMKLFQQLKVTNRCKCSTFAGNVFNCNRVQKPSHFTDKMQT